jgi:hypothetical protein
MDSDFGNPLGGEPSQQSDEVIDVTVDVAVGQKTYEVEGGALVQDAAHKGAPHIIFEQGTVGDCLLHELRTLFENAAGAYGVVAYLRVSHVLVTRKSDGNTVRLQLQENWCIAKQAVEIRSGGQVEGVALITLVTPAVQPNAIEDYQQQLPLNARKTRIWRQSKVSHLYSDLINLRRTVLPQSPDSVRR